LSFLSIFSYLENDSKEEIVQRIVGSSFWNALAAATATELMQLACVTARPDQIDVNFTNGRKPEID
jgi:hypothetical protein